jgi:hypothetical protein
VQWPTQRIEKGAPRTLSGRAEEWIAAKSRLIDDRRLAHGTVRIDSDPHLDDEILSITSARRHIPAPRDLLSHQVDFAGGNLTAERRS